MKKVLSVDITFTDLTYTVSNPKTKEKKDVLKSISGIFKSGEISAIMGPSGAGKSSLLNILTGFTKTGVKGNVNFGSVAKSRKLCSYILQEDHFFPWFTVEEAMILATALKISNKSMTAKEKQALIDNILDTLRLGNTKQTKCTNLSGGQKKRLSIALELIDNPPVLILDEPTTGLDSSASSDMLQLLEKLSSEGRTIICTIHQPSASIFLMFSHVYVLHKGYCVYQGSPRNTVPFLSSVGLQCPQYHNPADYLLEVVTGEYGDYTQEMITATNANLSRWRQDPDVLPNCDHEISENKKMPLYPWTPCENTKHIYPPPEWIRLWILIGRCHIQFYRDWTVTHLKFGMHILCSILVGLFYGDSGINASKAIPNISMLLLCIVYLWYTTIMPGVLRFPLEIATIKKETFNNWYKLRTYYIATIITSTPVHVIFSTAFCTIIYLMTEQPFELQRYVKFTFVNILLTIAADGLGGMLGALVTPVNGTFLGAILTCFMLVFSGFLILFNHMPAVLRIISYFSIHRFGLEGLVLSLYDNGRSDMICPSDVMYCHVKNAMMILETLGVVPGKFNFHILMIAIQLFLFKSLAYFALRRTVLQNT